MKKRVGVLILATVALSGGACGPRQVEVRTATPAPAAESGPALQVNNTLSQAVNVYVTTGGTDMFIRQVAASSSLRVPVQGVASGTTVTLKAVTADGTRTYSRASVVLSGTVSFPIP
jgi:hypothetical protein